VILNSFRGTIEAIDEAAFISRANQYQSSDAACICGDCFNNPNNIQEFSPDNPRFFIFKGAYNAADNSIDNDVDGVIEIWYSLYSEIAEITDLSTLPRVCPFECVGQFSYDKNYEATFLNILFSGQNFPSGSNTLNNFAGNVPATDGWVAETPFSVTETTDRAAIRVRISGTAGTSVRIRNLKFHVQLPT
jgi:hypothetical protein